MFFLKLCALTALSPAMALRPGLHVIGATIVTGDEDWELITDKTANKISVDTRFLLSMIRRRTGQHGGVAQHSHSRLTAKRS